MKRWTREDDDLLRRRLLDRVPYATIARALRRSEDAVAWRARHVVHAEPNRGLETLTHAAKRVGYHVSFLRDVILPWSNVRTTPSNLTSASQSRVRLVDPDEIDQAVRRFMDTAERTDDAASRLRVHANTVRNRMIRAGIYARHGYYRTSQLDEVFERR